MEQLKAWNWNVCAVYMLDSQFITDVPKYIAGCMARRAARRWLGTPGGGQAGKNCERRGRDGASRLRGGCAA